MQGSKSNTNIKKYLPYLAIAIIAIQLLLNVYLLRFFLEYRRVSANLGDKLGQTEVDKLRVEAEVYKILDNYNALKGESAEKDQKIDLQKEEILKQKDKIDAMIQNGADAAVVKAELEKLRKLSNRELKQLKEENIALKDTNTKLIETNNSLNNTVDYTKRRLDTLSGEVLQAKDKAAKAEEVARIKTAQVEQEKLAARESTIRAAHLNVSGITMTPISKKGKPLKLKKGTAIEFCFDVLPNDLVPKDEQIFYIALNSGGPNGMNIPFGNETCVMADGKKFIPNTRAIKIKYAGTQEKACLKWTPTDDFQEGIYELSIFHNGRESGTKFNFEIKR